jgi:hypothetical protein
MFFMAVSLFGAGTAFTSVLSKNPSIALAAGLILSAVSVLDKVIDPARRRASFIQDYKRYASVKRAIQGKSVADAEKLLAKAREDDSDEIESLRDVAYNDVIRQMGGDAIHIIKLNLLQRAIAFAA